MYLFGFYVFFRFFFFSTKELKKRKIFGGKYNSKFTCENKYNSTYTIYSLFAIDIQQFGNGWVIYINPSSTYFNVIVD